MNEMTLGFWPAWPSECKSTVAQQPGAQLTRAQHFPAAYGPEMLLKSPSVRKHGQRRF